MEIQPKDLRKSVYISQLILLIAGILLFWIILARKDTNLWQTFDFAKGQVIFIYGLGFGGAGILLQLMLHLFFAEDKLEDEVNKLFYQFSYIDLALMFLTGALGEEVLFRAALQNGLAYFTGNIVLAILGSNLIFAVLHFRYIKKPLLFSVVLIYGIGFGWIYVWTGSLWTSVLAHFMINFVMVCLGKKGIVR